MPRVGENSERYRQADRETYLLNLLMETRISGAKISPNKVQKIEF